MSVYQNWNSTEWLALSINQFLQFLQQINVKNASSIRYRDSNVKPYHESPDMCLYLGQRSLCTRTDLQYIISPLLVHLSALNNFSGVSFTFSYWCKAFFMSFKTKYFRHCDKMTLKWGDEVLVWVSPTLGIVLYAKAPKLFVRKSFDHLLNCLL